jgi:hypothetical protein
MDLPAKSGYILKLGGPMNRYWQTRYFCLSADGAIQYYKTSQKRDYKGVLVCRQASVKLIERADKTVAIEFCPQTNNPKKRKYILRSERKDEQDAWFELLQAHAAAVRKQAEGPLMRLAEDAENYVWTKAYCIHEPSDQGDHLALYRSISDTKRAIDTLQLEGITVQDVSDDRYMQKACFRVMSATNNTSWVLCAASEELKKEWISSLSLV